MKFRTTVFLGVALLASQYAMAWGERGHHTICEVATHLVQNAQLKSFLVSKGHEMGHVCNIPDIWWRDMGPQAKPGDAAHFMNPENLGYTIDTVPTDFVAIVAAAGKPAPRVADQLGSLWWRADQFFRNAVASGKLAKASAFPDHTQEQDKTLPFNRGINGLLVSLGLMGHFVGDASQPYHNTSNYDGWANGHGGVHAYYETTVINVMGFELVKEVETAALALRASGDFNVTEGSVLDRMKALSTSAARDQKAVEAADPVFTPSTEQPHKVAAKRASAEKGAVAFHGLIVPELARSALLLAKFWDEAFETSGAPDVFKYRAYDYPLAPDFVDLDYTK